MKFAVVLMLAAALGWAGSSSKSVHVHQYTRKDGTVVQAHDRSAPGTAHHAGTTSTGTVLRDSHGRIARSESAKHAFESSQPCPSTGKTSGACPGYVVDHIKPLACGGVDAPNNMQWQTVAEGKAKDAWERNGCR